MPRPQPEKEKYISPDLLDEVLPPAEEIETEGPEDPKDVVDDEDEEYTADIDEELFNQD